jgi:hypothetical protein
LIITMKSLIIMVYHLHFILPVKEVLQATINRLWFVLGWHWLMLHLFLSKRSTISTEPPSQAEWRDVVELLLSHEACDVNIIDCDNCNALHYACENGQAVSIFLQDTRPNSCFIMSFLFIFFILTFCLFSASIMCIGIFYHVQ